MPIFVWVAIAFAIVLLGAGGFTNLISKPVSDALSGPIGYALALCGVVVVGIVTWNKTRGQRKDKDQK